MGREKSRILVLVEGDKTDPRLMQHLLDMYEIGESHEIVSYHTNIYTLCNEMFRDGDPASKDILQVLKEHEPNREKKALFDKRYSDILLIFDLDPHDPDFTGEKVIEMAGFFVESSDMGKLYLNYPMVEAFYHMRSIPDADYDGYMATMDELKHKLYKRRVNAETRNHDYRKFAINRTECSIVIRQNIEKAAGMIENKPKSDTIAVPDGIAVLKKQLQMLSEQEKIAVLCTCAFYIPDYNPNLIAYEQ